MRNNGDMPTTTEPGTARPRSGRRGTFWLGIVLVLGALGVLGYAAWEQWGTNLGSWQAHKRIVQEVEKQWSGEGSAAGENPVAIGEDVVALIRIPRFGDDYIIPVLEGTTDKVLGEGIGHFDDTAAPGQEGNFAVAGHRVTHGEPFRNMPKLEKGDPIIVETREATYTYSLLNGGDSLEVTSQAGWVLDPLPKNPDGGMEPAQVPGSKLLTLIACAEVFHTDDRLIAFGELVETTPRA